MKAMTRMLVGWSAALLLTCGLVVGQGCGGGGDGQAMGSVVRGNVASYLGNDSLGALGKVVDLGGIEVSVEGTDIVTLTEDDGTFELAGVEPGQVTVLFSFNGVRYVLVVDVPEGSEVVLSDIAISVDGVSVGSVEVQPIEVDDGNGNEDGSSNGNNSNGNEWSDENSNGNEWSEDENDNTWKENDNENDWEDNANDNEWEKDGNDNSDWSDGNSNGNEEVPEVPVEEDMGGPPIL